MGAMKFNMPRNDKKGNEGPPTVGMARSCISTSQRRALSQACNIVPDREAILLSGSRMLRRGPCTQGSVSRTWGEDGGGGSWTIAS